MIARASSAASIQFGIPAALENMMPTLLLLFSLTVPDTQAMDHLSKFETWNREAGDARRHAAQADEQRRTAEARIQSLLAQRHQLQDAIREGSGRHGAETQKIHSFQVEERRLKEQIARDRAEACDVSDQLRVFATERRVKQRTFCQTMADKQKELGKVIKQREEERLKALLTVQTLPQLVQAMIQYQEKMAVADEQTKDTDSSMKETDEDNNENSSPPTIQELANQLKDPAVAAIVLQFDQTARAHQEAEAKLTQMQQHVTKLREYALQDKESDGTQQSHVRLEWLPSFRLRIPLTVLSFTITQQPLTESALLELEQVWAQARDDNDKTPDEPLQMQLYYGAPNLATSLTTSPTPNNTPTAESDGKSGFSTVPQ